MSSSGGDDLDDLDDSESQDDDDDSEAEAQVSAGKLGRGGGRAFTAQLRERLRAAPFDKELHAALIGALREAADLNRLQAARREAAARVALPEALWLEWLQDESNLGSDDGGVELEVLHAKACAACPSSKIWLARCSLLQDREPKDPEAVRACYEEALGILGLHPAEGPEIWAAYRDYEEGLLAALLNPKAQARQAERVRGLFLRQLAVPLPGAERTREALASFEGALEPGARGTAVAAKAEAAAAVAAPLWEQRAPLERRLQEASRPSVMIGAADEQPASPAELIEQLLALEEATGDDARITMGHLRMTQSCPQEVSRWQSFADAAARAAGSSTQAQAAARGQVLDQAVHHCPHVGHLWLQLHEDQEAAGLPLPSLRDILGRGLLALEASPQGGEAAAAEDLRGALLCQHADACRRAGAAASAGDGSSEAWAEMRASLEKAVTLSKAAGSDPSGACQVLFQWLRLEGYGARSAKGALAVGKRLMEFWGSYYHGWSQFIGAVYHCQDGPESNKVVRGLYRDAVAQVADYPDQVRSDWVQFERDCGTLESWREAKRELEALQKAKAAAGEAEAATAAGAAEAEAAVAPAEGAGAGAAEAAGAAEEEEPEEQQGPRRKEQQQKAPKKREEANAKAEPSRKRRKAWPKVRSAPAPAVAAAQGAESAAAVVEAAAATNAGGARAAEAGGGGSGAGQAKPTAPASKGTVPEAGDSAPDAPPPAVAEAAGSAAPEAAEPPALPAGPARVPPVQTLPPPAQLAPTAEMSPPAGGDEAMEGVVKQDEATTGAAVGDAEQAGEEKSTKEPHKGSHYHQKRFATNEALEVQEKEGQHTVYVSNLDWSVDEAQLYRLFGDIEGLKEVRLVRDFLKRSKGFAYVEFEARENVEEAVAKLDGHEVHKRPMKVAPSKPTKPLFEERTLFVKSVPASCGEGAVKDAFARFGEVVGVRMPLDHSTQGHKGYAYVDFASADALEKAVLGKEEVRIADQLVQVTRSIPMKDHRHQKAAPRRDMPQRSNQRVVLEGKLSREDPMRQSAQCPTTIHVKDLAFGVDEDALKEHFSQCGEVQKALVVRNPRGGSRGFGFVEFADTAGAQAALLLADSTLKGRSIVVSKSTRKITQKKQAETAAAADQQGPPPPAAARAADEEPALVEAPATARKAAAAAAAPAPVPAPALVPPQAVRPGVKRRINLEEAEPGPPRGQKVPAIARGGRLPFRTARDVKSVEGVAATPKPGGAQVKLGDAAEGGKPLSNADFRALLLGAAGGGKS